MATRPERGCEKSAMIRSAAFRIFGSESLASVLTERKVGVFTEIKGAGKDYVMKIDEEEYVKYLLDKHHVDPPVLDFDKIFVSQESRSIPAEKFPPGFNVSHGEVYTKPTVIYHIPCSGEIELLRMEPNPRLSFTPLVFIDGSDLCFEVVNLYNDMSRVERESNENLNHIRQSYGYFQSEIKSYNSEVKSEILSQLQRYKRSLLKAQEDLASLGYPLKTEETVDSYSVPTPKIRDRIFERPTNVTTNVESAPTLPVETYYRILDLINEVGKQFERLPATYKKKSEEGLRDDILLQLGPGTGAAATGESFNKSGKTDILIQHEGNNVFVAECKFWDGQKKYLSMIDQLLGYLTWRDSKTALIVFVRNKEITPVLDTIRECTPNHPNYLSNEGTHEYSWFDYKFHIEDDPGQEIKLATMVYHIPSK